MPLKKKLAREQLKALNEQLAHWQRLTNLPVIKTVNWNYQPLEGIRLFEISEYVIWVMKNYKKKVNKALIQKEEVQTLYSKPQ